LAAEGLSQREIARRVAVAIGLPGDYFPEFREAFVLERIKADPKLRNELYARLRNRRVRRRDARG
jgi:hypothetical protein